MIKCYKKIDKYVFKEDKVWDIYESKKDYFYKHTEFGYDDYLIYKDIKIYSVKLLKILKLKNLIK